MRQLMCRFGRSGNKAGCREEIWRDLGVGQGQQYLMITETQKESTRGRGEGHWSPRLFKIVKQNSQHLVLTDGRNNMIFKTYTATETAALQHLQLRTTLNHPTLLSIHKIETQSQPQATRPCGLRCGILFEKYQKTLQQSLREMASFSHQEIFQTFYPIKDALQYLVANEYDPGEVSLRSIVCSEDYQIKFMEGCLHEQALTFPQRPNFKTLIFEEFVSLLFNQLFPAQKHIHAWKSRYQIAQAKLSQPHFQYFQNLYLKFAPASPKAPKSKKIKKQCHSPAGDDCKRSQRLKTRSTKVHNELHWQEGKQNKIMQ